MERVSQSKSSDSKAPPAKPLFQVGEASHERAADESPSTFRGAYPQPDYAAIVRNGLSIQRARANSGFAEPATAAALPHPRTLPSIQPQTEQEPESQTPSDAGTTWQVPARTLTPQARLQTDEPSVPTTVRRSPLDLTQRSFLWNRSDTREHSPLPSVQAKSAIEQPDNLEPQRLSHIARAVMNRSPAHSNTQPEVEDETEEIQPKPLIEALPPLVQRQAISEDEESVQAKCESCESEESIQRSPDGAGTSAKAPTNLLEILIRNSQNARKAEATPIQPKLTIGQPGDRYEQEADQVAATVMAMPAPTHSPIQRQELAEVQESEEEPEEIQTKPLVDSITPLVQRQPEADSEEIQTKEGEEEPEAIQAKPVADSTLPIQRQPEDESEEVQAKSEQAPSTTSNLETQLANSKGGGSPLGDDVRSFMESRFNTDFSHVRVHTDSSAVQMNKEVGAKAFTHGQDIYFNSGHYSPDSQSGKELLAHEPTHTIQQTGRLNKIARQSAPAVGKVELTPQVASKELPNLDLATVGQTSSPQAESQPELQGEVETASLPPKELSSEQSLLNLSPIQEDISEPSSRQDIGEIAPSQEMLSLKTLSEDHYPDNFDVSEPSLSGLEMIDTNATTESAIQPKFLTDLSPSFNSSSPTSFTLESGNSIPSPNIIQRDGEDDGGGLLGGIRRTINSIVEGLRSGWSGLTQMAQGAFEGLQGQFSNIAQGLGSLVSSALSGIQSGWTALSQMATQLTQGMQQQLQGAIGTLTGAVSAIGQAIVNMDAAALQAAFGRVTGLIGGVFQQVQQAGQAVFQRINSLWSGLQNRFNDVLSNLTNRASQIFGQLQAAAEGVRQRLTSAWTALQNRASQMSGVLGGVLERLRSLVNRLLSWGQQIWNGIQQQWTALRGRLDGFLQGVRQQITSALQGLRQRAMAVWQSITGLWTRASQWVRQQAQRVLQPIKSVWDNTRSFDISQIVQTILHYAPFLKAAYEAAQNPDVLLQPIAQTLATKIAAEMPAAAEQKAREHTSGGGQSASTAGSSSTSEVFIQRTPLEPAFDQSTLWSGFLEVLGDTWQEFAQDIPGNILKILYESIAFWETIPREWDGLKSDLSKAWERMHTAGLGFWRHLIDIPLIVLRRAKNIVLALYPWFVLLSTLVGAIAGGVAGTAGGGIAGAILGFMAGGAPAVPGAAGGAAAGGGVGIAGGAGIGLGFALGIGEGLLAADIAIEAASLVKAWTDLSFVDQTKQEQVEDLSQMVSSAIAVAVGGIIWAASAAVSSALAGKVAQGILSRLRPGGAALRFLQGMDRGFRRGSPFRRQPSQRPVTPRPGATVAEFIELQSRAQRLITEIETFARENPGVQGLNQMQKAARGELRFIERVTNGQVEPTPERLAGTRNNLSGIESELEAARTNPGVVGVNRKFSLDGRPNAVEVDVIADQGRTWIDRKRVEPFGLESSNWVGRPGKQGLQVQAQELMRSASQNPLPDGTIPTVVLDFPLGVSEEVANALRQMGVQVRGRVVPPPPVPVPVRPPIIPNPSTDESSDSE